MGQPLGIGSGDEVSDRLIGITEEESHTGLTLVERVGDTGVAGVEVVVADDRSQPTGICPC